MEFVPLLRALWRRRILVLIGAVVSIGLGIMTAGGETTRSGVASARLVLDTQKSQLIYRAPKGHETLTWRAELLADLTASRPLRERVANDVGIPTDQLLVVHPPLTAPVIPTTLPSRAAKVASPTFEEYILTVRFNELAPIISIDAAAPNRRAAARLAGAASAALQETGTTQELTRGIQPLAVENVGPVRSRDIVDKPKLILGVAMALVLFCLWCGALALGPRLLDFWRSLAGRPQAAA